MQATHHILPSGERKPSVCVNLTVVDPTHCDAVVIQLKMHHSTLQHWLTPSLHDTLKQFSTHMVRLGLSSYVLWAVSTELTKWTRVKQCHMLVYPGCIYFPFPVSVVDEPDLWKWTFCHLPSFRCQILVSSECFVTGSPFLLRIKLFQSYYMENITLDYLFDNVWKRAPMLQIVSCSFREDCWMFSLI